MTTCCEYSGDERNKTSCSTAAMGSMQSISLSLTCVPGPGSRVPSPGSWGLDPDES